MLNSHLLWLLSRRTVGKEFQKNVLFWEPSPPTPPGRSPTIHSFTENTWTLIRTITYVFTVDQLCLVLFNEISESMLNPSLLYTKLEKKVSLIFDQENLRSCGKKKKLLMSELAVWNWNQAKVKWGEKKTSVNERLQCNVWTGEGWSRELQRGPLALTHHWHIRLWDKQIWSDPPSSSGQCWKYSISQL